MKIETFSIVVGGRACNAKCPFCVSRMTGKEEAPEFNERNFHKAARLAQMKGVTTVLLTGKGEPTLYMDDVDIVMMRLRHYDFPFIEMQTNGFLLASSESDPHLNLWYQYGMTTICLSIVHWDGKRNNEIYQNRDGYDLPTLISRLKALGFSIRLSVMMLKDYVHTARHILDLVEFAKDNGVQQLTARTIRKPAYSEDENASAFVDEHALTVSQEAAIHNYVEREGNLLMTLPHGAKVFDLKGQNLCLTDCLTIKPDGDHLRQLIYFASGRLGYDWQYPGAILC